MRIACCLAVAFFLILPAQAQSISAGGCTANAFIYPPFTGNAAWLFLQCPDTAWFVVVQNSDRGLQIGPAYLQRAPGAAGIQILTSANIAENFTPYHTGDPTQRLSDTQFCNASCVRALDPGDVAANGMLLTVPGYGYPTIGVELRDRGVAWMCKSVNQLQGTRSHLRRGMEMVVWGTWDPGNYDYAIQYTFRDDGQISFRAGATGWNNNQIGETVPHMHDILWRVDMQLGTGLNTPFVWSHYETSLPATDSEFFFNNGYEGAMDLDDTRFATLVIEDQMTNAAGHRIGYELQPFGAGSARHYGPGEGWSLHDTWVTRFAASEAASPSGLAAWTPPDVYLLGNSGNHYGVFDHQTVVGQDLVLWHISSAHHEPHDEDNATGNTAYHGLTLMHWSGFDLVPHNLFDANPLGGPHRSLCDGPP